MIAFVAIAGLAALLAILGMYVLGLRERVERLESQVASLRARSETAMDDSLRALIDEVELAGDCLSRRAAEAVDEARAALSRLAEASAAAAGSGSWLAPSPFPSRPREAAPPQMSELVEIQALAARDQTPADIARLTGRSLGEVEMARRMAGRRGDAAPDPGDQSEGTASIHTVGRSRPAKSILRGEAR